MTMKKRRYYARVYMRMMKYKNSVRTAMTLVEVLVAITILATIMAVFAPQFRVIQNSWASKQAQTEIIQNGRVFIEHITSNLGQATKITAVSAPAEAGGYIEFLAPDNITRRYHISGSKIYYGEPNAMSELAATALSLNFSCYGTSDLTSTITDPNYTRSVKVNAVFKDPANTASETYTSQIYLRTNGLLAQGTASTKYFFDIYNCYSPALATIDSSHFICAYTGFSDRGIARILSTNPGTGSIFSINAVYFDPYAAREIAICKIDSSRYLLAYESSWGRGYCVMLYINPSTYAMWIGSYLEFDSNIGDQPALEQISATKYLCVYRGSGDNGYAVVLTVNTSTGNITKGGRFCFDSFVGKNPVLAKIDSTHYLTTYRGENDDGWSAVLAINPTTYAITKTSSYEFDTQKCDYPSIAKYDNSYYLCAYAGKDDDGYITLLKVEADYSISALTTLEYDTIKGKYPSIKKVNTNNFICSYQRDHDYGSANIFTIKTNPARISLIGSIPFDNTRCVVSDLAQIDENYFLCAYQGPGDNGYCVLLNTQLQILP